VQKNVRAGGNSSITVASLVHREPMFEHSVCIDHDGGRHDPWITATARSTKSISASAPTGRSCMNDLSRDEYRAPSAAPVRLRQFNPLSRTQPAPAGRGWQRRTATSLANEQPTRSGAHERHPSREFQPSAGRTGLTRRRADRESARSSAAPAGIPTSPARSPARHA